MPLYSYLTFGKGFWDTWNNSFKSPLLELFPSEVVFSRSWLFLLLWCGFSVVCIFLEVQCRMWTCSSADAIPTAEKAESYHPTNEVSSQTLHPSPFLEATSWHCWLMFKFINRSKLLLNLFSISKYPAENKVFDVCCQQRAWRLPFNLFLCSNIDPLSAANNLQTATSVAWMVDFQTYQKAAFLIYK